MRKSRLAPHDMDWLSRWFIPEPNSGCWLWEGQLNAGGYGAVGMGGKTRNAHRVAYQMNRGVIPVGMDLDHLCRVRCCVNPAHLEPVTRGENLRRGLSGANLIATARAKTECPAGHAYSGANLYIDKRGRRGCNACRRAKSAAWNRRQQHWGATA